MLNDPGDVYKDSTLIMQMLCDHLPLWTSDQEGAALLLGMPVGEPLFSGST